MPSEPQRPQSTPIGTYWLLAAATLLYIPWLAALVAAPSWDEPGSSSGEARISQAWAEAFTFAFGIPLWLALAGAVVFSVALVVHSRRRRQPFIDVRMLARNRPLTMTYLRAAAISMIVFSVYYEIGRASCRERVLNLV